MLEELKQQLTNLSLQRAQAKDTVEYCERAMGQVAHTVQILEAQAKASATAPKED